MNTTTHKRFSDADYEYILNSSDIPGYKEYVNSGGHISSQMMIIRGVILNHSLNQFSKMFTSDDILLIILAKLSTELDNVRHAAMLNNKYDDKNLISCIGLTFDAINVLFPKTSIDSQHQINITTLIKTNIENLIQEIIEK
jgi:hypothetical protein